MKPSKFTIHYTFILVFVLAIAFTLFGVAQAQEQTPQWYDPTEEPTEEPTTEPTEEPTAEPTEEPTTEPTEEPTAEPTEEPTTEPTEEPTTEPTEEPTAEPTEEPTTEPTEEPTTEPTAEPTVEPTTEPTGFTIIVDGPDVVTVGDTFDVSVIAESISDPGIFGYQFWLNWDDTVLTPVEGTLNLSDDFPLIVQQEIDAGVLKLAVSRQGEVDDLTGPLTLLTWTFEATVVTDPDAVPVTFSDWKFGRKGGVEVPVDTVIDLDVIVEAVEVAGAGDIDGVVLVEGRAADNQADHEVTAVGSDDSVWADLTASDGYFWINDAPADTYTVTANSAGFLAATCDNVAHTADALTTFSTATLLAGDLDDSGNIDITDAVAIGTVFGNTGVGEVADLNADGVVDILDLILLGVNYGQTSAGNPWVCQ